MASRIVQTRLVSSVMSLSNHQSRAGRSLGSLSHHISMHHMHHMHHMHIHTYSTTRQYNNSSFLHESKRSSSSRNKTLRELGIRIDRIPPHHQPPRGRHHRRRPRAVEAPASSSSNSSTSTIRVKSVHAAQKLDVVNVLSKVFGVASSMPPVRHMFGKTSVIVQLTPPSLDDEEAQPRFVAVYRFGSVVFFNMSPRDSGKLLEAIKKHG